MKIVLVTSYMKSKGGVSRFVWEFAKFLISKNDSVILISLFTNKEIYQEEENLKIVDLANDESLPQSLKFWLNLGNIQKKLSLVINENKPDVVMFHDFPATLWAQKYHTPVLCYTHDIHMLYTNTYINNLKTTTRLMWRFLRLFIRYYDRKKWRYFDEVFSNSKFLQEYILKKYKVRTNVIYPGTNTAVFTNFNDCQKEKAILTMGDIKLRKVDFLLDVTKQLVKNRNDFKIWIVGNKDNYDIELKEKVKKAKLENNVEFFGKVSDSKLAELYSKSIATVHLVKEAPFGLIVTEAMACGSPVISWKPGGPEEIIENGKNGFLIDENNSEQLMEKIEIFLNNPELSVEMGNKARIRIKEYFESSVKFSELRDRMSYWINKKIMS